MDYPGTKLTRRVRIAIMCTLITAFFVISPITILYTAGYRYDWQKHSIQQTGVISIDIKPTDAQVFLNNIKIEEVIPIRLSNRAPGVYNLKIQRSGYYDWTKEINVESKKTTYIKDITLFKQSLPIRILEDIDNSSIQNLYSSRTGKFLIVATKKDSVYELYLYNTETKKLSQIIREENDNNITVEWSPFGDYALIKIDKNTGSVIEIFNPDNPELSENYSFSSQVQNYQWPNSQYSAAIFISENKTIWKLNNGNKENLLTINSSVWYIDSQNNIWSLNDKKLTKNNTEIYNFPEIDIDKIIYLGNNQILIKKSDKVISGHFDNDNVVIDYDINVNNLTPYSNNNAWLAWTPWELWSIQNNGSNELYTRSSEMIKTISPTENNDTVLILFETRLVGFNSRYFTLHELLKNADIYSIGNNTKKRQIYFFGKVANTTGIFEMEY